MTLYRKALGSCFLILSSSRAVAWKHTTSSDVPLLGGQSFFLASRGGGGDFSPPPSDNVVDGFALLSDTVLYDKWRRLISRKVRFPSGLVADFEIVSQSSGHHGDDSQGGTDQAVLVFVWNTSTKTATLISEYMPSTHCKMHGLAAGVVEADKHNNSNNNNSSSEESMQLAAAKCELEEECRLTGGQWIQLTKTPVVTDKYCTTAMTAFLVLDPVPIGNNQKLPQRDVTEEGMTILENVSIADLRRKMTETAEMTIVGTWATLLALDKLREMGEIP